MLPVGAVCDLISPVIMAVSALSEVGLLHRDIKPANIVFRNGVPCLADIGLLAEDDQSISRVGTPGFLAPSWYLESGGNPDMWGIASTLYTVATGNSPDKLGRPNFRWPPLGKESISGPEQSRWLELHKIIYRATSERASERFLRIGDLSRAIEAVAATDIPRTRNPAAWQLAALSLALAVGGFAAVRWQHRPPEPPPLANPATAFQLACVKVRTHLADLNSKVSTDRTLPKPNWPALWEKGQEIVVLARPKDEIRPTVDGVMKQCLEALATARTYPNGRLEDLELRQLEREVDDTRQKLDATARKVLAQIATENGMYKAGRLVASSMEEWRQIRERILKQPEELPRKPGSPPRGDHASEP